MGKQELIKRIVREELEECEALRERLEMECSVLPRGSLIRRSNGNLSISIRENGRQYQVALSADDEELINQLKKKRYINMGRRALSDWIEGCRFLLSKGPGYDPVSIEEKLPEQYKGLLGIDIFLESDVNPDEWKASSTKESKIHPENLIHQTTSGIRMRSKSEVLIGTLLEKRKIPYKYEVEIECEGSLLTPDFEILHPRWNRLVYLEHLGMIDNPDYVIWNLEKMKKYARSGLILGYNLFFTYESQDKPLTITDINKVIDEILALEY